MSPRVLFLNVNGSGLGHMTRCLAYARRLRERRVRPVFFSLASAIEIIEEMGFEADYFVSHYWSANSSFAWNSELAVRFGMMLERVRPAVVVFDGTWPFQGFIAACNAYGAPALVWSNRGLLKADTPFVAVDEAAFDLIIQPGELNAGVNESRLAGGGKKITVPPVCLLEDEELLDRAAAREALGLPPEGNYVLFSLGPGNLKDVSGIGINLVCLFESVGIQVVWARPPISVKDVALPPGVKSISRYPLVRYLRAFDAFVGAAGYNTCCEVMQAQIPSLLVPNAQLADDQARRAQLVAQMAPVVVSTCETEGERRESIEKLLGMMESGTRQKTNPLPMDGASLAADEIVALAWAEEKVVLKQKKSGSC
jgi:UDP:flavonoid glycosyltransferase YjiC (YdhE family)